MKKFTLSILAVVITAFAMTSCIDNAVSPEVKAIRAAQVNLLNAHTAFRNAEAAVQTSMAALNAAYANVQNANAAATDADTEAVLIANQVAASNAEVTFAANDLALQKKIDELAEYLLDHPVEEAHDYLAKYSTASTAVRTLAVTIATQVKLIANYKLYYVTASSLYLDNVRVIKQNALDEAESKLANAQAALEIVLAAEADPSAAAADLADYDMQIQDLKNQLLEIEIDLAPLNIALTDATTVQTAAQAAYDGVTGPPATANKLLTAIKAVIKDYTDQQTVVTTKTTATATAKTKAWKSTKDDKAKLAPYLNDLITNYAKASAVDPAKTKLQFDLAVACNKLELEVYKKAQGVANDVSGAVTAVDAVITSIEAKVGKLSQNGELTAANIINGTKDNDGNGTAGQANDIVDLNNDAVKGDYKDVQELYKLIATGTNGTYTLNSANVSSTAGTLTAGSTYQVSTILTSSQTVGPLVVGQWYTVATVLGADDFTNVGRVSAAAFQATGTTPTVWASASIAVTSDDFSNVGRVSASPFVATGTTPTQWIKLSVAVKVDPFELLFNAPAATVDDITGNSLIKFGTGSAFDADGSLYTAIKFFFTGQSAATLIESIGRFEAGAPFLTNFTNAGGDTTKMDETLAGGFRDDTPHADWAAYWTAQAAEAVEVTKLDYINKGTTPYDVNANNVAIGGGGNVKAAGLLAATQTAVDALKVTLDAKKALTKTAQDAYDVVNDQKTALTKQKTDLTTIRGKVNSFVTGANGDITAFKTSVDDNQKLVDAAEYALLRVDDDEIEIDAQIAYEEERLADMQTELAGRQAEAAAWLALLNEVLGN